MTKRHHQPDGRSTIYKGADGLWHGRVSMGLTDQGRKDRRHVSSKSKTVVTEKVAEWERTRDDGLTREIRENWTVEAWLTHWLEHLSRPFVKQGTYEGYRAAVKVHLIPGIGRHRLQTLRPEHLERLYVSMLKLSTRRGTPMSPGRVHQVHRTIRTALNEAVRRGHLARNPAEMAKTPLVNDYDVEPYTVDEVQQLFVAAQREPNGARWVFALALGLRQGEALGLQWGDVDWSRSVLTIKRSRTRPRYEHRCQPHCGHQYAGHCPNRVLSRPDFDTTKSRAGRRVVPLPAAVLDLLRDHAKAQAVQRRTAAQLWVDEGWIFSDEIGRALNPRTDWDHWKKLLKAAGVRDGRLHDARHTAATVLLLLGVHERTIMSVLGWSTTAMVSRYAHVVAPIHSDVASRLDVLLWSSPNSAKDDRNVAR
jgi:integrase